MKKYIFANWKSYKTQKEAEDWVRCVQIPTEATCEVAVFPTFTQIPLVTRLAPESLSIGAQDVSPYPLGPYTGAIAADQLQDLRVKYCLIGHSERRRYFNETYQDVSKKAEQLVQSGITPVICVDKDYIVEQQAALTQEVMSKSIVAYEPLAAIGSGSEEDIGTVQEVVKHIHSVFGDVPVIYGGSVAAQNVGTYLTVLDGVLVGSKSLDCSHFNELLAATL